MNEIQISSPNDILSNLKKAEKEKEKKNQDKFSFETDFLNKKNVQHITLVLPLYPKNVTNVVIAYVKKL